MRYKNHSKCSCRVLRVIDLDFLGFLQVPISCLTDEMPMKSVGRLLPYFLSMDKNVNYCPSFELLMKRD